MLKIRRPLERLIFNMGIAIPGKTVFLIETAPCSQLWWSYMAWTMLTLILSTEYCQYSFCCVLKNIEKLLLFVPYHNLLLLSVTSVYKTNKSQVSRQIISWYTNSRNLDFLSTKSDPFSLNNILGSKEYVIDHGWHQAQCTSKLCHTYIL